MAPAVIMVRLTHVGARQQPEMPPKSQCYRTQENKRQTHRDLYVVGLICTLLGRLVSRDPYIRCSASWIAAGEVTAVDRKTGWHLTLRNLPRPCNSPQSAERENGPLPSTSTYASKSGYEGFITPFHMLLKAQLAIVGENQSSHIFL